MAWQEAVPACQGVISSAGNADHGTSSGPRCTSTWIPATSCALKPLEVADMAPPLHSTEAVIGVDTGGTFTDLVLILPPEQPGAPSRLIAHKLLSTPDDPGRAVARGIEELLAMLPAGAKMPLSVI